MFEIFIAYHRNLTYYYLNETAPIRVTTMKATYISKDQNWNDGTTTYWFDVNGETYGVVDAGYDAKAVVDCDSVPTTDFITDNFEITEEMIAD